MHPTSTQPQPHGAAGVVVLARPSLGVGCVVLHPAHPRCLLLGQRISSHGTGQYQLPGGALEHGESWEECAVREVEEETGLTLLHSGVHSVTSSFARVCVGVPANSSAAVTVTPGVSVLHVNQCLFPVHGRHDVTFIVCGVVDVSVSPSEPETREPTKCGGWEWVEWTTLTQRKDLFIPLQLAVQQGLVDSIQQHYNRIQEQLVLPAAAQDPICR